MKNSTLVKIFGFGATLVHGDTTVLDRWRWLQARLPITRNGEALLDVGCGSGAFSIGASLLGYSALGLSWDAENQATAAQRASLCGASSAAFEVLDVRRLDQRNDLVGRFDVVVSCENIEHVLDDSKLMADMAACLKPGGRLLLTTPNFFYRAITAGDNGPFSQVEDGGHVRRGYTRAMLEDLCAGAGLVCDSVSSCTGFLSQKLTALLRVLARVLPYPVAWGLLLPLRILPPMFDGLLRRVSGWPDYSICLEAYKPRLSSSRTSSQLASASGRQ